MIHFNVNFNPIPGVDFKNMPPCRNVLLRKIHRTKIITSVVKNACKNVLDLQLTDGWHIDDNMKITIEYFTGSPYPDNLGDITINETSDDEEESYVSESDDSDAYNTEDE